MVESEFLFLLIHFLNNVSSTIQAFPCMTDGQTLSRIPCFDGTQRPPWSLCCCVMQMPMAVTTESQLTSNKENY